jgi:sugar phosphate isomerase/epimerase
MKLGCCTWNFTHPHYEAPYEDAVRTIGQLGFDGVEMIVFTQQDLDDYYTPSKIRELRSLIGSYDMEVSEFVLYAYCADGLESADAGRREQALEVFARAANVARELGAPIINIVSHWVEGLTAPIAYPPSYIHPIVPGVDRIEPTLRMTLPADVDWSLVWSNYVESLSACTQIAQEHDLTFTVEGHAHVIVSGTDAMLRLFDAVPSPSIGVNFDTAWHLVQREYLPMSIAKLGDRIRHVHVRDADGNTNYNLPPGRGIIDWHGVITALQGVGYDGFLSLEMGQYKEPERYAAEARQSLERVLDEVGVAEVGT